MNQTIRIIGGTYRGKKIQFPDSEGLRPTPDRVRETLFNWLMHDITNARCLDAFAGSGALGLEAFSRGAREVVFLEQVPKVYAKLKQNIESFSNPKLHLKQTNALEFLNQSHEPFDVIFLDPPFAKGWVPVCLDRIASHQLITERGLIYTESAQPIEPESMHWDVVKNKKAGQVYYSLLQRRNNTC